jgi:hypothetical protein
MRPTGRALFNNSITQCKELWIRWFWLWLAEREGLMEPYRQM